MVKAHLLGFSLAALIAVAGTARLITSNPAHQAAGTAVIAVREDSGFAVSHRLPENLTKRQADLLAFAYETAKRDGLKDPALLQGLILTESNAGEHPRYRVAGDANDRYFGVAQIKLAAADDVLRAFPQLWEGFQTRTKEEVMARLVLDDYFNISVASKYLLLLSRANPRAGVDFVLAAYNRGLGGALANDPRGAEYAGKVKASARDVKG